MDAAGISVAVAVHNSFHALVDLQTLQSDGNAYFHLPQRAAVSICPFHFIADGVASNSTLGGYWHSRPRGSSTDHPSAQSVPVPPDA